MTETMTEPVSHTLEVPGAVLTYDVRRSASSTDPILLLIGSPRCRCCVTRCRISVMSHAGERTSLG